MKLWRRIKDKWHDYSGEEEITICEGRKEWEKRRDSDNFSNENNGLYGQKLMKSRDLIFIRCGFSGDRNNFKNVLNCDLESALNRNK